MADICTKQVYEEKVYLIYIEANDAQIRKRQWSRGARKCIIFLQKIDKQLLILFDRVS